MSQQDMNVENKPSWGVRRILGILIAVGCIIAIACGVLYQGRKIYDDIVQESETETDTYANHLSEFLTSSYSIFIGIEEMRQGTGLTPEEVFFQNYSDLNEEEWNEYEDYYTVEYSYDMDWSTLAEQVYLGDHLKSAGAIRYLMLDNTTDYSLQTVEDDSWLQAAKQGKLGDTIKSEYPLVVLIQYDSEGNPTVLDYEGASQKQIESALNQLSLKLSYPNQETNEITDVTFLLAVNEDGIEKLNWYYGGYYNYDYNQFTSRGFVYFAVMSAAVVILLAGLLMVFRLAGVWEKGISQIPVEIAVGAVIGIVIAYLPMSALNYYFYRGDVTETVQKFLNAISMKGAAQEISYFICIAIWSLYLGCIYIFSLALFQVFRKGLRRYFRENSIVVAIVRWVVKKCKNIYQSIISFDFDDNINRVVLKIVLINAVIIAVMCSIWFFGWGVLLLYSIVVFYLLRNYMRNAKQDYGKILSATEEMAGGNLNVQIEEEVGLFNPLKDELLRVKEGFSRAVEEEVKSQNMRNELITNVSHDLKTPLTAIITYVELLKDDNATEEQRKEYIATLDQKSQRLKQLIEDLFEVSKLNSNNVQMQFISVDLVSLIKQIQFENEEKLKERSIELVSRLPENKVMLMLDSQKTYRIFENLLGNISKYAMPNTRAYVELTEEEREVIVNVKNISEHMIDVNGEVLTERFVRGDASRNTEGSGLGLAIVKSLVEKQGGSIQIIVDGDLFKVVIRFPEEVFCKSRESIQSESQVMETESSNIGE